MHGYGTQQDQRYSDPKARNGQKIKGQKICPSSRKIVTPENLSFLKIFENDEVSGMMNFRE